MNADEERLAATVAAALERSLAVLPPGVDARLRALRRHALRAAVPAPRPPLAARLLPAASLAAAAWLALAALQEPPPLPARGGPLEAELLSAPESLDFYDELAFYRWLHAQGLEG